VPVDVGPDQVGAGGELPGVVFDRPVVHLPDLLRGARHVAGPHLQIGLTEPGAGGEQFVAEQPGLTLVSGHPIEHHVRVPGDLVLELQEGCGKPFGVYRVTVHPGSLVSGSLRTSTAAPGA
jgi:hypothetical protein